MLGTTAGKYRIIDRLGRGSMGTVYRATDETLHRDVAIKVLNADFNDPAAGRRFRAEAIAIARLNHPGIAKIYDLFEHDGQMLMAIELVQGETLEQLVSRTGPLSADAAAELVSQAVMALAHAHGMGVVHRDLKPANIMVANGRLKIMDFGIARVEGSEHLTSAGLLMGTPAYMAPEQVMGHDIDARTDIFAMGCVLSFLATARLPFHGETAMELVQSRVHDVATPMRVLRPDLPEWFEQVVAKALARNPADRFQTAMEFREAMERGRAGLPLNLKTGSAPTISAELAETMLPGTMPVADATGRKPATPTPDVTVKMGAADKGETIASRPPAASAAPSPATAFGRWAGAGAALVVVAGLVWWFLLRPPATTVQPPASPAETAAAATPSASPESTVAASPAQTPAPTQTPSPAATAAPALTPGATVTPTATPKPSPTPVTDAPVSFDSIKVLHVTGRRGDVIDSSLKLGGGTIVVLPKRMNEAPTVAFSYRELVASTYVRDREPRWFANLPGPPSDVQLPGSVLDLGRRPVRHWLVLQGKGRYAVLILADADAAQILQTVADRSRVKIDRPVAGK